MASGFTARSLQLVRTSEIAKSHGGRRGGEHAVFYLPRLTSGRRPSSAAGALGRDQGDRPSQALVGHNVGAAQVLEPPQHVVVPPGREGEAGPVVIPLSVIDYLAGRQPPEHATLEEVLLPAETGAGHLRAGPDGRFGIA